MGQVMITEDARLVDVPRNKVMNADVIRSGDTVFIKYTKPKYGCPDFSVCRLYSTEKWAFPLCIKSRPWQKDFMDVLVRLGLMTKEYRERLIKLDTERWDKNQRKMDSEALQQIAGRYGLRQLQTMAKNLQKVS